MQRKFLVSLTATATAFSMLAAPSLTAFAEDTSNSDSAVTFSDGQTHDIGSVTTTDGDTAVTASNDGTVVNVDGDIDASGATESKDASGNTIYDGAKAIKIENNATVNVDGDVTGAFEGAWIYQSGNLNVDGDVTATGSDKTVWGWNPETKSYDIPINTSHGDGITTSWGDGNINVTGDVSGVTSGLDFQLDNNDNNPSVTVGGTISTSGHSGIGISIFNHAPLEGESTNAGAFVYDDVNDVLDDLPNMTIYEIDAATPVYVHITTAAGDISSEMYNKVVDSINYIIKKDESEAEKYDFSISGDNIKNNSGYDTVNINQDFNVAASLPDGYTISGGDNVNVTKNSDNTYTLTLTNVKGGIFIKATLIPVTQPDGTTSVVVVADESQSESNNSDQTSASSAIPSEAISVVSAPAGAGAPAAAALPVEGAVAPSRSVSINITKLTPMQYKEAVVHNIAATPAGTTLRLETDRVSVFDKTMIEAIASNPTIDVEVLFTYNGQKVRVVIPAGYDVRTLLDSNGYCGFLRLASILGSQTVE